MMAMRMMWSFEIDLAERLQVTAIITGIISVLIAILT
jgi:hypothetical protein